MGVNGQRSVGPPASSSGSYEANARYIMYIVCVLSSPWTVTSCSRGNRDIENSRTTSAFCPVLRETRNHASGELVYSYGIYHGRSHEVWTPSPPCRQVEPELRWSRRIELFRLFFRIFSALILLMLCRNLRIPRMNLDWTRRGFRTLPTLPPSSGLIVSANCNILIV